MNGFDLNEHDLIDILKFQCEEIAKDNIYGWGNTMHMAAELISGQYEQLAALKSENDILSGASKELRLANALLAKANARLQEEKNVLRKALEKIIQMNLDTAQAQYGDRKKAEDWACVRVAKSALERSGNTT